MVAGIGVTAVRCTAGVAASGHVLAAGSSNSSQNVVPNAAGDTALDSTMFKGKAMTYYGRWTYKYEIATEKGAAAAIIIIPSAM